MFKLQNCEKKLQNCNSLYHHAKTSCLTFPAHVNLVDLPLLHNLNCHGFIVLTVYRKNKG